MFQSKITVMLIKLCLSSTVYNNRHRFPFYLTFFSDMQNHENNTFSIHMSLVARKPCRSVFPTRSDTNQAIQPQKMARGLKFQICKVEGLHYLYSENKCADQLHSHSAADLHLCFGTWRSSYKVLFKRCQI